MPPVPDRAGCGLLKSGGLARPPAGSFLIPPGLGGIPYDAEGKVLPPDALVLTRQDGWSYPILDAVSPPAGAFDITDVAYDATLSRLAISWHSEAGRSYQVWYSGDLSHWVRIPGVIPSGGERTGFYDAVPAAGLPVRFYRVERLPVVP